MQNVFRSRIRLLAIGIVGVAIGFALPKAHYENDRMEQEAQRERTLAAQGQATYQNAEKKAEVIRELLVAKIDLVEAANRFQKLHEASPFNDKEKFRCLFEGNTDQERYCRQVMMHAKAALRHETEVNPEIETKLQEQFDAVVEPKVVSETEK